MKKRSAANMFLNFPDKKRRQTNEKSEMVHLYIQTQKSL